MAVPKAEEEEGGEEGRNLAKRSIMETESESGVRRERQKAGGESKRKQMGKSRRRDIGSTRRN